MKWIGQQIWDLASRFRDDVYFEDLAETTETRGLVVDADGKLSINPLSGDEHATHIYENVRNDEGSTIPVGTPVYSKGEVGGSERILVGIANANDPTKMPAIGITNTELTTTGDTKDGLITLVGVYNTNISGFSGLSVNNIVYVASGGGLTITKPTGVNLIQNVGVILKTNGSIIQGLQVTCVGRTNDVPTPLHIDHANQRLGIGTVSPTSTLHVSGNARIEGDLTVNGTYTQIDTDVTTTEQWLVTNDGTGPAAVINQLGTEDIFDVQDDGTSVFYIEDGGNIGIGTTSPDSLLHVSADVSSGGVTNTGTITIEGRPAGYLGDDIATIDFHNTGVKYADIRMERGNAANDSQLVFSTSDAGTLSDALIINEVGNVGIGTTSPQQLLDITNTTAAPVLRLSRNQNLGSTSWAGQSMGDIEFYTNDPSSAAVYGKISLVGGPDSGTPNAGYPDGHMTFFTRGQQGGDSLSERMRITDTGNVGVGQTSPAHKLDVAGYIRSANTGADSTTKYSGFFGRHYTNSEEDVLAISTESTSSNNNIYIGGGFGTRNSATTIRFSTAANNTTTTGTERMRIDSNGSVGIGTSSPNSTYKLHVAGKSYLSGGIQMNSGDEIDFGNSNQYITGVNDTSLTLATGGSATLTATHAGNVGIGTTSPSEKLNVAGNMRLDTGGYIIGDSTAVYLRLNNSLGSILGYSTGNIKVAPSFTYNNASGEQFRINHADGNVGIGTNNPSEKLEVVGNIKIGDSDEVRFGADNDLRIYHNGTNSNIENFAGTLQIVQTVDDEDITFRCDDGSGGTTPYLTLDGSAGHTVASKEINFADGVPATFGNLAGGDLEIKEQSGNSYILNHTGNLTITNHADDKDIIFQSDDNSGGVATYFYLDGSIDNSNLYTVFPDNAIVTLGTGYDLQLFHDGTNSYMVNSTGSLTIRNVSSDSDILFIGRDGGSNVTALTLDMSAAGQANFNSHVYLPDAARIKLGAGHDLQMWHESNHSYIANATGNLTITNNTDDGDIIFQSDDGSGGVETYMYLNGGVGVVTIPDNKSLGFGADGGNDFYISHNGTNTNLSNYQGDLYFNQNANDKDIIFQNDDGSGGLTTYLTLDGSAGTIEVSKVINSTSGITSSGIITADTYFLSSDTSVVLAPASNGSVFLRPDGYGSGTGAIRVSSTKTYFSGAIDVGVDDTGHDVKFYGATSGEYMLWDESEDALFLADNTQLRIGGGGDLRAYHNGTNSYFGNYTGDLFIFNNAADKDIILQSDDGSGGTTAYLTLDGGLGYTIASKQIRFSDGVNLYFGNSNDVAVKHDGTDFSITNNTGDFYIKNTTDDKDIIFQSDDGSGGVATYFFLDGSLANGTYTYTRWNDNDVVAFGSDSDMQLLHDASNSHIVNYVGDLKITNNANDKDIIFNCDDGSGGNTAYLTLDGSAGHLTVQKEMQFLDSVIARFGNGNDMSIQHNSNDSLITNNTGDLYIQNTADDKDIIFQSDDGSGGNATYLTLDGGLGYTTVQKRMQLQDSVGLYLGTSTGDFIYHNGSNTFWTHQVGDLTIESNQDDGDIIFRCDDGSGGTTEYLRLDGGVAEIIVSKKMQFGDNVKAVFGAGEDLDIFHDGTNSEINNAVGNLILSNDADDGDIIFASDNGSGGRSTYLTIDGGSEEVVFSKPIVTAETKIKVLPHHFMSNEDGGANKSAQFRDDTIIGVRTSSDDAELYAFVEIPYGKTARTVTVYGNDTSLVVNVYESDINAGALTDKTPGGGCVVGTSCDITDVAYSATNYLVIKVTTLNYTNDVIYGAEVVIG